MVIPSEEMREATYSNPNSFLDDDVVARKILSAIAETRLETTPSGNICLAPDASDRSYEDPGKSFSPSSSLSVLMIGSPGMISCSVDLGTVDDPKSPKAEPHSKKSGLQMAKVGGSSPPPTMQDLEYCDDLAVAVAVYDDSNEHSEDGYLPKCVEYDPDSKATVFGKQFYRRFRWFLLVLALLTTGAVAFAVVSVQKSQVEVPTEWMRTEAEALLGGDMELQDEPYRKALEWMMYQDPMREGLSEMSSRFVQRYVMTYFYFATSVDKEWAFCAPPQELDKPTCTFLASTKYLSKNQERESITVYGYRWLSEAHECEWVGVACNSNDEVEKIDLDGLQQSGSFPEGIYHLAALQYLGLNDSSMRGPLPKDVLSHLTQLQHLQLRLNSFTGIIPVEWFSAASPLTHLDLSRNQLTGSIPSEMGLLRNLTSLVLSNNDMNGTLPEEVLGGMPTLTDVDLNGNNFTGTIPTSIGKMSSVILLGLHLNNLQGTIPTEIGLLDETLYSLYLGQNDLYGELPSSIYTLKNLVVLDVSGCSFDGTIKQSIARSFPIMRELYINNNQFSGPLPEQISGMKSLRNFQFEDNSFTGVLPEGLCLFVSETCCDTCCQVDGMPCNATQHSTD